MTIENLYTSHVLADRLQRARFQASDRARTLHALRTTQPNPVLWIRLRRAVGKLS